MTEEHKASRTIVKSPPELWAECSVAQSLARHLGEFGEIRITRLEPETTVAWEGEHASGTVRLEPSGWGTQVTLTATPIVVAAPEPAVEPEPVVEAEPVAVEPAPVVMQAAEIVEEVGWGVGASHPCSCPGGKWCRGSPPSATVARLPPLPLSLSAGAAHRVF